MAHQIDQSVDGTKAAFASAHEDAWHQLGTVVDHSMSADEALDLAHLRDWNVRKTQLTTNVMTSDGQQQELIVPDQFAIVRDNPFQPGQVDVFGVAGKQYTPIQNEAHAELLDNLKDESGGFFETAGAIKGGSEVFLTIKLPDTMMIGGKDPVDTYIAALNTHHGQKSFQFIVTPVRVVCANTQAAAIRSATASFKARHTKNSVTGITQQVRDALGLTFKLQEEFQTEADKMIEAEYTNRQFAQLVKNLYPVKDNASDTVKRNAETHKVGMTELFKASPTISKDIAGTRWAAYQSVTEYLDHFQQFKGKSVEEAAEFRAISAIQRSDSGDLKNKAFQLLSV